eukprot:jgi/Mesvir1/26512/Mv16169-RA.1
MLIPAFQLHLSDSILPGLACIGKYDGKYPALTCATSGGKMFMHNPHKTSFKDMGDIRYLNINKKISAVACGMLDPVLGREILLVGTQASLLAYDVNENADLFFKDVSDGVNKIVCGPVGTSPVPLAVVGGNCSIQGFDSDGNEQYWTVTGGNVTALALVDVDMDGLSELLVGSDDYEIRIFRNDEAMAEMTEAEKVTGLCGIHSTRYGYALGNGTVGVYDKMMRAWRVKSKHGVQAISAFDLDADGMPELISGWANGKMEVRHERTGQVVFKDHFSQPISALLRADYRMDGRDELICCAKDGEVKGFLPVDPQASAQTASVVTEVDDSALQALNQRKQELMYELRSYEQNMKLAGQQGPGDDAAALIPSRTRVTTMLEVNRAKSCVELVLATNNETMIKGAVIFAEQIFEDESFVKHLKEPASTVRVGLRPLKDVCVDMLIKVIVGTQASLVYHVFELDYRLPKFCLFAPVQPNELPVPDSSVSFTVKERAARMAMWISDAFNVEVKSQVADRLDCCFVSLRDGRPLNLHMAPTSTGTQEVRIVTDNMELAGEIVTELAAFMGLDDVESVVDFPHEMEAFKSTLVAVEEHNAVRLKLVSEMADASNLVKSLVIKAEDARLLGDMPLMKQMYSELYDLNRELIMEHTKGSTNHEELLAALKQVNKMIQKASQLRVGPSKTRMVAACRNAIKANNIQSLFKIMKLGEKVPPRK